MATSQDLVRPVLISQLGRVGFTRLKFDRDCLAVEQIGTFEDDSERSLSLYKLDESVNLSTCHPGCRLM